MYSAPKNDPYRDNEQRTLKTRGIIEGNERRENNERIHQEEINKKREIIKNEYNRILHNDGYRGPSASVDYDYSKGKAGDPLIDMNLRVTTPPAQKKKNDITYMYPVVTGGLNMPPQFMDPGSVYAHLPKPVIRNEYVVNIGGILSKPTTAGVIYEDQLPIDQLKTFDTIEGRTGLTTYIRSQLLTDKDGEDISLGTGANNEKNLLSYLKLLRVNPYSDLVYTKNPYVGLPDGILIYNSCYPIRLSDTNTTTICAKDSIGVNIRIYKIGIEEYTATDNNIVMNSNVWRDIFYYEYIRDKIIKSKVCPNFVYMHLYYLTKDAGVDFNDLHIASKNKGKRPIPQSILKPQPLLFPPNILSQPSILSALIPLGNALLTQLTQTSGPGIYTINADGTITRNITYTNTHSGEALIALTEGPNYSLSQWASPKYEESGGIKKVQIRTGSFSIRTWNSIFFQIAVALYVLQKHKIIINNFDIDNIFIKELKNTSNVTSYWKYKIDGIDFYIPNYGFMVLIDSVFKGGSSLISPPSSPPSPPSTGTVTITPYIQSGFMDSTLTDIEKTIFNNMFKSIFNSLKFNSSSDFNKKGGVPPEKVIIDKLDKINGDGPTENIRDYIDKYYAEFMNNRIGTYLKEDEIALMREHEPDTSGFKRGDILVYTTSTGMYRFVMYLKSDGTDSTVITKEGIDAEYKQIILTTSSLTHYSKFHRVEQDYKPNEANMGEDNIIDIYTV
jgi:hypothetical protein